MRFGFSRSCIKFVFTVLMIGVGMAVSAQTSGLLYDPEPPVDSAYVRIFMANVGGPVDVLVDDRIRLRKLGAGNASDYMILPAGEHTIAIHPAGKSVAYLATKLEVVPGRAMTVAFTALRPDASPVVFEDKANSNKLKALLAVYQLAAQAGPLDVTTADGRTKVFSAVPYGTSSSIQVNPITIELIAAKVGDSLPQARTSLGMTQGGTYSIMLFPGVGGKVTALSIKNSIEKYNGK
jgi:alginate O-acetyltransferase complex protein AlgF